jgi:3D (Asp-Asp-Asp) domain-containing protein
MKTIIALWVIVVATIYHAVPEQTNSDPGHTATMFELDLNNPRKHNIIAVSRDLESRFPMGSKVCIENAGKMNGVWYVEDRMNKRFTNRIDFLVNTTQRYGKWKRVKVTLIE